MYTLNKHVDRSSFIDDFAPAATTTDRIDFHELVRIVEHGERWVATALIAGVIHLSEGNISQLQLPYYTQQAQVAHMNKMHKTSWI